VGTDSAAYTIGAADFGKSITVTVSSQAISGSIESGATAAVELGAAAAPGGPYQSLAAYLSGLPANTASTPATVVFAPAIINNADTDTNGVWATVNNVVQTAGRYVILDLSACSAINNTISGDSMSASGNKMNIILFNTRIKGIILPSTLTSIGSYAFNGCCYLTSVSIPSSVTSIGWAAFWNCELFMSVTIPASVIRIESYAFAHSGLTSVTFAPGSSIPSGSFGPSAFPEGTYGIDGDTLKTAYAGGHAGTYTRTAGGADWTKQ
jgi:hypothetical protein